MTVSARTPQSLHRLTRGRRFHHCGWRHARTTHRAPTVDLDLDLDHGAGTVQVQTPAGPEAAAEALAWLARQSSWQSTLAGLEAGAREV